MDQQQISQLAQQIADQTAFHNIGYWLSLLAVALVSTVASFFGSYWKKRAETAATDADLKKIINQLELTTRTTEGIRSVVSLGEWSERERRTLRRVKLEEMIVTAHKTYDWIIAERNRLYFESSDQENVSPLPLMVSIGKLFFPELRVRLSEFAAACDAHCLFLRQFSEKLTAAKSRASEQATASAKTTGNWLGMQDARDAGVLAAATSIREQSEKELMGTDLEVSNALSQLDEAAATLMAEIIAPSPS